MKSILLIFALFFGILSCGKGDPLKSLVDKYNSGDSTAIKQIEKNFLPSIAEDTFYLSDSINSHAGLIYQVFQKKVSFRYPFTASVDVNSFGLESDSISFSGNSIFICRKDSLIWINAKKEIKKIESDIKRGEIKAASLLNDKVIIYQGKKVYRADDQIISEITTEEFLPPYDKSYIGRIYIAGDYILLASGIAGEYSLSVIDSHSGKVLVKNIGAASAGLYFDAKHIVYITGATGHWKLAEFEISSKKKIIIKEFQKLHDIQFFRNSVIYDDGRRLFFLDLKSGKSTPLPFRYHLFGSNGEIVFMESDGTVYAVNASRLYEKTEWLRNESPGIFEK